MLAGIGTNGREWQDPNTLGLAIKPFKSSQVKNLLFQKHGKIFLLQVDKQNK
jgi:hypothetical protein